MKVLIDNGHGIDTKGKRSPDGRLREYAYAREIAIRLQTALGNNVESERIVKEDEDIDIRVRVERANKLYEQFNRQAILVSIHCNAAGDGSKWMTARGWSVFVDPTASANSRRLATDMADIAKSKG